MTKISNFLFGVVALLATVSCSSQPASIKVGDPINAHQEASIDIKGKWEEESKKLDSLRSMKEYPGKKLDILLGILKEVPDSQLKAELERIRQEPEEFDRMTEYDQYLLQALFLRYANGKDRAGLVYLLSAKCPRFVATSAVELEVASLGFSNPMTVLFDSYDAATTAKSQEYLLAILRESFKELSQKHTSAVDFIRVSRAWYSENASKITPNPYYHPFVRSEEQRDLFVPKS